MWCAQPCHTSPQTVSTHGKYDMYKDCGLLQRHAYIDLWRVTPVSLAWLLADGNLCELGLAQLLGSGFKKGCIFTLLFEFESTLLETLPSGCFLFFEGELFADGNIYSTLICEWDILMTPPESHSGKFAHIFMICTLSTALTLFLTILEPCLSRSLYLWSNPPPQEAPVRNC